MATVNKLDTGTYQVRWLTPERRWKKKSYRLKATRTASPGRSRQQGPGHLHRPQCREGDLPGLRRGMSGHAGPPPTHGVGDRGQPSSSRLPAPGPRPIGAIRHSEIQALVKAMHATLAPTTVELIFRWVQTVFKAAVADRTIPSSPCVGIKLPNADTVEIVPLAVETVEALIDATPDRYRAGRTRPAPGERPGRRQAGPAQPIPPGLLIPHGEGED